MIEKESTLKKICNNCAYFHKITQYSTRGYCYWLLQNKDKQVNSNCCCYCWVDKNDKKAFGFKEEYIRKVIKKYEKQTVKDK